MEVSSEALHPIAGEHAEKTQANALANIVPETIAILPAPAPMVRPIEFDDDSQSAVTVNMHTSEATRLRAGGRRAARRPESDRAGTRLGSISIDEQSCV